MFSQFFGNFLLNNKIVKPNQLAEAIQLKKTTRLKLGVLAINAGFMTSKQVDEVHAKQATVDKRFGDIAVDFGFVTEAQVDELLSSQKLGYLILGQALVDKGYMNNAQFEKAIADYKAKYKITENELSSDKKEALQSVISEFYHFDTLKNADIFNEYILLLYNNIIRFIGDDFTPLEANVINNYKCNELISQNISGDFSAYTAIEADPTAFVSFASRYAGEELGEVNEFSVATVGEFLNLHNGLFSVNMSNSNELELKLTPQTAKQNITLNLQGSAFCIPLIFPFGTVNFILSNTNTL